MRSLTSDALTVEVAPEHGFVIASIALAGSDENILWNPPGASFEPLSVGNLGPLGDASAERFDRHVLAGGWFPMFPTAGPPGAAEDRRMHGELPRLAWTVIDESAKHITASVVTPDGMQAERTVQLERDKVLVRTRMHNDSANWQEVTFGEHPCFARAVFSDGVIEAQPVRGRVISIADSRNAFLAADQSFAWPMAKGSDRARLDVSTIPSSADGRHDHVLLEGVSTAHIRGSRHVVDLQWDARSLPNAVLWQHFRPAGSPWNGDVFALEPVSALGRTFTEAQTSGTVTKLAPGEGIETWISMKVRPVNVS